MVSHELRTPLTSIKGSAATARSAAVPLDPAETWPESRPAPCSVAPEPTDVADVIYGARDAFLSSGYRNSVEVSVAPNLRRIPLDRQRVSQVLYNLFSNASKYSREWSTIRVTASLRGPARDRMRHRRGARHLRRAIAPTVQQVFADRLRHQSRDRGGRPRSGDLPRHRGSARGPHLGREQRRRPRRPLHIYAAHRRLDDRTVHGSRHREHSGRVGLVGAHSRHRRRPAGPALRAEHSFGGRLLSGGHQRSERVGPFGRD